VSETMKNLAEAFAGESQANRRYIAFAKRAEEEGFPNVAKLFRAAAESETVHALNHLKVMGGVGSTAENLRKAKEGEDYERTQMYPEFIKKAEEEGMPEAVTSFRWASKAEEAHSELYQQAIEAVESGRDADIDALHVCQRCGYTVAGEPPERCPVCGASGAFREIE